MKGLFSKLALLITVGLLFAAVPAAHAEGSWQPPFDGGGDPSAIRFCIQNPCEDSAVPKFAPTNDAICVLVQYDASCKCTFNTDMTTKLEGTCILF